MGLVDVSSKAVYNFEDTCTEREQGVSGHPSPGHLNSVSTNKASPVTTSDEFATARSFSPSNAQTGGLFSSVRVGTGSEASGPAGHRSKFHPVTFHHSHFSKNIEKDSVSLVHLKQALFPSLIGSDQTFKPSDIRPGPLYLGDKVYMRTGSGTVTRDSRTIAVEKEKRRQLVSQTGFSSANHETYKALGDPILDPERLIATVLNVSVSSGPLEHHSASHSVQRNFQNSLNQDETPKDGNKYQVNVNDGFELLHEKLMKAKGRLQAIKFGIPLAKTFQTTSWCHEEKSTPVASESVDIFNDWTPTKLDREKMIYYMRYIAPQSSSPTEPKPAQVVILPKLAKTYKERHMTVDEMERALMIQRTPLPDPETMLHQMRSSFNKDKQRLAGALRSQLLQAERERAALVFEKFRVFKIGVNGICSSDLELMRANANRKRKLGRRKVLEMHPWYNDMVKLAYSNFLRKSISDAEKALLLQIRIRIGDKVPLDKREFVDIIKVVPSHDFMKEEVQKLIKFLKTRIGLTELEYLDAIEMSGQMLTTSSFQTNTTSMNPSTPI